MRMRKEESNRRNSFKNKFIDHKRNMTTIYSIYSIQEDVTLISNNDKILETIEHQ